jgi:hypothetical protein
VNLCGVTSLVLIFLWIFFVFSFLWIPITFTGFNVMEGCTSEVLRVWMPAGSVIDQRGKRMDDPWPVMIDPETRKIETK